MPAQRFTLRDFDFELPAQLIAQHPCAQRSASRLLDGRGQPLVDRIFHQLPDLLQSGDLLVFNDTQVVKARVFGEKASGGKLELLIERVLPGGHEVVAHMKVSKKPLPGARLHLCGGLQHGGFDATLLGRWPDAQGPLFHLALHGPQEATAWQLMEQHGHLPLPPYIERQQASGHDPDAAEDGERYQTVYAKENGSAAAPTAGLHFTQELLQKIEAKGVHLVYLTLHVGLGTFRPVSVDNLEDHEMHSEFYQLSEEAAATLRQVKAAGKRIVAVGTTSIRTLETIGNKFDGDIQADSGWTNIFIKPGYEWKVVDAFSTNFHLPKSTLVMLVSAFAGREFVLDAYKHAVQERYRFFSFGDAMFVTRPSEK